MRSQTTPISGWPPTRTGWSSPPSPRPYPNRVVEVTSPSSTRRWKNYSLRWRNPATSDYIYETNQIIMTVTSAHLKAAFENTTGIARSHGPQEAYDFADRNYKASLTVIQQELDKIVQHLRSTGDTTETIARLEAFTGLKK